MGYTIINNGYNILMAISLTGSTTMAITTITAGYNYGYNAYNYNYGYSNNYYPGYNNWNYNYSK